MSKTIGEILKLSYEYIQNKGSSHGRHEVEECIAASLGFKRLDLYLNFDKPLNDNELAVIRKKLARLAANEPLQYIEGIVNFYDCKIRVDSRVLIPRPETELLVDYIVRTLKGTDQSQKILWDICTGSGCIGIAIKKALPELQVFLSDISSPALELAELNAKENGVSVTLFQGDLFEPFKGMKADYIVCNPPYISLKDYDSLEPHVKNFEPKLALVGGTSGLEFYEGIAKLARNFLNPKGHGFLEVGAGQAESICKLFSAYSDVKSSKDLSGIERFVEFQST